MHFKLSSLPCALVFGLGVTAAALPPATNGEFCTESASPDNSSVSTNSATAFALIYGYPLVLYVQTFVPTLQAVGANAILNEKTPAYANIEVLVRPNVDTLYSRAAIDLSQTDVVLSIPKVPEDRFYVVPFNDLYGNNFANIGSISSSPAGDYLLTVAGDDEPGILLAGEGYESDKYTGIIKFPGIYGSIMMRIVIKNNGTDLDEVHAIQDQVSMATVEREGEPLGACLTPGLLGNSALSPAAFLLPFNLSTTQTTQTLQMLAKVHASNPPIIKSDAERVNTMLAAAGIKDGQYTVPAKIDYTQVHKLIGEQFLALLDPSNHAFDQSGWFVLLPSLSGNFGVEYTARAWIAWFGYLQLADYIAAYPTYLDPTLPATQITLQLAANESYIMTFSEKPPVTGFWSLTAYNETNYLVANGQNVYSLGDRSNLTYADGTTQVYADASSSGAFSILIQPAEVTPSANWTSNWLPGPAGGGIFTVNLRWYGPTESLLNGSYVYPIVSKQAAIV
ncbi:hypothetical protein IFR05_008145 [Cadophora sp. M221]|nr:hypothetical protein IFR05_008145 [Cadophora sp. M221]